MPQVKKRISLFCWPVEIRKSSLWEQGWALAGTRRTHNPKAPDAGKTADAIRVPATAPITSWGNFELLSASHNTRHQLSVPSDNRDVRTARQRRKILRRPMNLTASDDAHASQYGYPVKKGTTTIEPRHSMRCWTSFNTTPPPLNLKPSNKRAKLPAPQPGPKWGNSNI